MGMLYSPALDQQTAEFLGLQAKASDHAGFYQAIGKPSAKYGQLNVAGFGGMAAAEEPAGGSLYMIVSPFWAVACWHLLRKIVAQWQTVVNVRGAYERLDSLLTSVPLRQGGMPLPAPHGQLLVDNLVASAPGRKRLSSRASRSRYSRAKCWPWRDRRPPVRPPRTLAGGFVASR